MARLFMVSSWFAATEFVCYSFSRLAYRTCVASARYNAVNPAFFLKEEEEGRKGREERGEKTARRCARVCDLVWLIVAAYRSAYQRQRSRKSLSESNPLSPANPFTRVVIAAPRSAARNALRDLPRVYFPRRERGCRARFFFFFFFTRAPETQRARSPCTVVNIPTDVNPRRVRPRITILRQVARSFAFEFAKNDKRSFLRPIFCPADN